MVVVSVLVWLAIGLAIAFWMVRRGHAPAIWFALSFYGPLLALLAMTATETEAEHAEPEVVGTGEPGGGPIDVLVGIDGSPEAVAALDEAVMMLGERLGRLSVATVLDHDEAQIPGHEGHQDAARLLSSMGARVLRVTGRLPTTEILGGPPATALAEHALDGGFDLVVVGSRGRGATRLLVGSVATHLSSGAGVPVLVVPAPPPDPHPPPVSASPVPAQRELPGVD